MTDVVAALKAFEADGGSLERLTARLNQFNIFTVLGATKNELRHSNILAWLFDPRESHGLGDRFLESWIRELIDSGRIADTEVGQDDQIRHVRVYRERSYVHAGKLSYVDLLIEIRCQSGFHRVVCIENKIGSVQSDGQLARYFRHVEREFRSAHQRNYVLLSRDGEVPEHNSFCVATYRDVLSALRRAMHGASLESDVKSLLESYADTLRENFMPDSPTEQLAQDIYDRHSQAIEYIVSIRQDKLSRAANMLDAALTSKAAELGIAVDPMGGTIVRFLPKGWDVDPNRNRGEHASEDRYVWCEITFHTTRIQLDVVCGFAPLVWKRDLVSGAESGQFEKTNTDIGSDYFKPHRIVSPISKEEVKESVPADAADHVLAWLVKQLRSDGFLAVSHEIANRLPAIGAG